MPRYIVPPECKPHVYRNEEFYKVGETFTVHTTKDLHIKFVPADAEAYAFAVAKFGAAAVEAKHGLLFGAVHVEPPKQPEPPKPVKEPVRSDHPMNLREMAALEAPTSPLDIIPAQESEKHEPKASVAELAAIVAPAPPAKKGWKGRRGK